MKWNMFHTHTQQQKKKSLPSPPPFFFAVDNLSLSLFSMHRVFFLRDIWIDEKVGWFRDNLQACNQKKYFYFDSFC